MRYASLFSGIGGLEHRTIRPVFFCEKDPAAQRVLATTFPGIEVKPDVATLDPLPLDCVVGGWPCQDITVAGRMSGIRGERSGLFFEMVRYAKLCGAHTIIGENVPNLLRIRKGQDFRCVLETLVEAGYAYVSWRCLDAREFGLPQSRRRVVVVASTERDIAWSLHRGIRDDDRFRWNGRRKTRGTSTNYGFYWTGGLARSLCLGDGIVPPLKVGSSTSKGTSPVAVFVDGQVRKLSASAGLRLQGFSPGPAFAGHIEGDVFRMAGNAVPLPVGHFALQCATTERHKLKAVCRLSNGIPESGVQQHDGIWQVEHTPTFDYESLELFLDADCRELSPQASAGLLTRVIRAKRRIPTDIFDALYASSRVRTRLIGTRINSFDVLDDELDACAYRSWLLAGASAEASDGQPEMELS